MRRCFLHQLCAPEGKELFKAASLTWILCDVIASRAWKSVRSNGKSLSLGRYASCSAEARCHGYVSVRASLSLSQPFLLPGSLPALAARSGTGQPRAAAPHERAGSGQQASPLFGAGGGAVARDALDRKIEGKKIKKTQQELEIPVKNAASVYGSGMAEGKGERSALCWELSSVPALPDGDSHLPPGGSS